MSVTNVMNVTIVTRDGRTPAIGFNFVPNICLTSKIGVH